jgi:predicted nucleotidyltransferase
MILLGVVGSTAYGLATPASDIDYKGICIGLKQHYLGCDTFETLDIWDEPGNGNFPYLDNADASVYELRKFVKLLANCNPSILDLLFLDNYEYKHPVADILIQQRELFVTSKAKYTYSGYALQQLQRIERHRNWLLKPITHKPEARSYGFVGIPPLTKDQIGAFLEYVYVLIKDKLAHSELEEEVVELLDTRVDIKSPLKQYAIKGAALAYTQELTKASDNFMQILSASQRYQADLKAYHDYINWQKNRNPARAAMEARVGYDCKHMSTCLRLLQMGIEILTNGDVIVDRRRAGDQAYLMEVKNGNVFYEKAKAGAMSKLARLNTAAKTTTLPEQVADQTINDICLAMLEAYNWGKV